MPGKLALFMVAVWLLLPAAASAELYRFTDDQGLVHYTDTRPPDHPHQSITLKSPSVVTMSDNLEQGRRVTAIRKKVSRALDRPSGRQRKRSGATQKVAKNEKQCAAYRKRLARIQQQLRAGYSNDRGNSLRRQRRTLGQALSRECLLR
ncbi:DUF4124 domain-containing protein [Marinobacter sp.]|uniref:DUF4124 domain-containing protein n=1 Tax=Marinobacter sp. TaxID=50741 RepID=UPI0034A56E65